MKQMKEVSRKIEEGMEIVNYSNGRVNAEYVISLTNGTAFIEFWNDRKQGSFAAPEEMTEQEITEMAERHNFQF